MQEQVWIAGRHLIERAIAWTATSGIRVIVVLLLAAIALRVLAVLSGRFHAAIGGAEESSERRQRADTLSGIARTIGSLVVLCGAGMMVLREIGFDIGPMLATAGIGGLAIGFGAQTLVKDVITGFFLLVEDHMRVGDVVEVAGKSGVVEQITLRTIRIRDLNGAVHVIPNSSVTTVSNMTRGFSRYVVDVPVTEKADPKAVFAKLEEVGAELARDERFGRHIVKPLEILGIESPTRAPVVKARITTQPRQQWVVGRELNLRIRQRFAEAGIELR